MGEIIPTLRMLERLLVVGFAGMSILLGYRLFFHMPTERSHKGLIQLPGIKVVLSRVGPGIFFLVFGAFILLESLHEKIKLEKNHGTSVSLAPNNSENFVGATEGSLQNKVSSQGLVQKRNAIFEQIGELNCSLKLLESPERGEITENTRIAYHAAKVAMLRDVWDDATWGSIESLDTDPNKHKIKSIFYDTSVGCPYD